MKKERAAQADIPEGKVLEERLSEGRVSAGKTKEYAGLNNTHRRDSSGKTIFKDPILCAQFLRDYVDVGGSMLKDVQPEDIEDVTERFIHMFTEEREADAVKKIRLGNHSFYVISLIEHKSDIDYNTIMQVFRYIAFIWEDYGTTSTCRPDLS